MARPGLVITRRIYQEVVASLQTEFDILADNQATDQPWDPQALQQRVAQADYMLCSVADKIDASVIAAATRLKVIATGAVGFNNIDVAACKARGIRLTNTPDVLTQTTADFGFALMMATARRISESERYARAGQWSGWAFDQFAGRDLHHATLGIIGMGRIGSAIARRAAGFEMRVLYHNRTPSQEPIAATWVEKTQLLQESDFVMLVVPYSPATHHLIGAAELALMKPSATLINIARGGVVDDQALIAALKEKRIAAAGLDVFENEPKFDPAFLQFENVVITPHIASSSRATRGAMMQLAADNLLAHARGLPLLTPVA
ncbi:MAG: D-glycerate dehydrogenase [Betaproteobacteria bacterium]|jgi:glyoxylate/hydroxypyruvate/2-ketogluconate reductase|nr:D-glycerate dehydrogenase [Betaproteobacteria bacterium]